MKNDRLVSASELAEWLGVKPNTLQHLATDGTLPRAARGKYPLRECVNAYCNALRKRSSPTSASAEKARLVKVQADAAEHKLAVLRDEYVLADEVKTEWASIVRHVRGSLLAVTSRISGHLPQLGPPDLAVVDREIRDALTALADEA